MSKALKSLIWGPIVAIFFLVLGIVTTIRSSNPYLLIPTVIISLFGFTFVSCLVLDNNFVGERFLDMLAICYDKLSSLVSIQVGGFIITLLVRILLLVVALALGVVFITLIVVFGFVTSLFIYPFAMHNGLKEPKYKRLKPVKKYDQM